PRTLEQFGVHVDGIGTTPLAGALELTRPIGDSMKGLIGLSVRHTYDEFVGLPEAIESAAELAGLEKNTYMLDYVEQQLGFVETLMLSMTSKAVAGVGRLVELPRLPVFVTRALDSSL